MNLTAQDVAYLNEHFGDLETAHRRRVISRLVSKFEAKHNPEALDRCTRADLIDLVVFVQEAFDSTNQK